MDAAVDKTGSLGRLINHLPFVRTARKYDRKKFKADILAGLTVGIVALPQSMAYAVIAGINPKYGLYAAIIPVIISSLFGSSRFLVAGPTNAISMVIFSTMASTAIAGTVINDFPEEQKIALLFLLAFLIGAIQLIMGLMKLGNLMNFISHSVIVGFTSGAGILIAFNQVKNLLGINIGSVSHFTETVAGIAGHIRETNLPSLGLGSLTIILIAAFKKFFPRIPGPFLAMAICAVLVPVFHLDALGVKMIGNIPRSLPPLSFPYLRYEAVMSLLGPALAIAILGIVEALSIAKSIANSSGEKIDGDQEFIGQGLSNLGAAFFSGMPGSGSFTRSAVNFRSGAKTRFAGAFSALTVLLTLLILAPLAKYIPISSLAGILMVVAYSMVDKKGFVLSFRSTKTDRLVLIATLLSTIFFELEMAVYVGVFMSIVLFLRKVSHPQVTKLYPRPEDNKLVPLFEGSKVCHQISICQIDGSLFFGAISELDDRLRTFHKEKAKAVIIRMKGVRMIDATGVHALERFLKDAKKSGIAIIFTGVRPAVMKVWKNSRAIEEIGKENIVEDTTQAIEESFRRFVDPGICRKCPGGVFKECHGKRQ